MSKIEHFKKHLSHTNNFIENNQGIRFIRHIFRFLGLVILIATGIQISYQLSDRKKEIKVREASHRHLLRENLYSQIPGSSGKGEALQELMMIEGDGLQGLDLSCERMKGGWHASTHTCKNPVTLYGLDFEEIYNISQKEAEKAQLSSGVAEYGIDFNRLNFSGVNVRKQNLSHLSTRNSNLKGADFSLSNLYSSNIQGTFRNFKCQVCNLSASKWSGDFTNADFLFSNLSDASFYGNLEMANWRVSWAWADALPKILNYSSEGLYRSSNSVSKFVTSVTDIKPITPTKLNTDRLKIFLSKLRICDPEERVKSGYDSSISYSSLAEKLNISSMDTCPKLTYQEALKKYPNENTEIYTAIIEHRHDPHP